jgi:hypothetical protein
MSAWFTPGACGTPRDVRAAYISLWYSYSVDVFTDLLGASCFAHMFRLSRVPKRLTNRFPVMFLPLGLIRNLQMHWKRKVTIAALFCLGWVCIAVSTIRVTYLGHGSAAGQEFKQPSTSWLALWGIVEAAIGTNPNLIRRNKHLLAGCVS